MDYFLVSDCCGCEMTGLQSDYGLCPECGEHCEVITDDSLESDYIPGLDDGEF